MAVGNVAAVRTRSVALAASAVVVAALGMFAGRSGASTSGDVTLTAAIPDGGYLTFVGNASTSARYDYDGAELDIQVMPALDQPTWTIEVAPPRGQHLRVGKVYRSAGWREVNNRYPNANDPLLHVAGGEGEGEGSTGTFGGAAPYDCHVEDGEFVFSKLPRHKTHTDPLIGRFVAHCKRSAPVDVSVAINAVNPKFPALVDVATRAAVIVQATKPLMYGVSSFSYLPVRVFDRVSGIPIEGGRVHAAAVAPPDSDGFAGASTVGACHYNHRGVAQCPVEGWDGTGTYTAFMDGAPGLVGAVAAPVLVHAQFGFARTWRSAGRRRNVYAIRCSANFGPAERRVVLQRRGAQGWRNVRSTAPPEGSSTCFYVVAVSHPREFRLMIPANDHIRAGHGRAIRVPRRH